MPPIFACVSISPHWSQKGSKIAPHLALHLSFLPGVQSGLHFPPAHPARQSLELLIAFRCWKTLDILHGSVCIFFWGGVCARHSIGRSSNRTRRLPARILPAWHIRSSKRGFVVWYRGPCSTPVCSERGARGIGLRSAYHRLDRLHSQTSVWLPDWVKSSRLCCLLTHGINNTPSSQIDIELYT